MWFDHQLERASCGDPGAQLRVGKAYKKGTSVEQDFVEAYKWYMLAMSAGATNANVLQSTLETDLSENQIAEAKRLAADWKPATDC